MTGQRTRGAMVLLVVLISTLAFSRVLTATGADPTPTSSLALGGSGGGRPPAGQPPPTAWPTQAPPSAHQESEPAVYAALLRDPASAGFTPDEALLRSIHAHLKKRHISLPPDSQLFASMAREVQGLLREAGLPDPGLSAQPRNPSLPARIIRLCGARVPHPVLYYAMIRGLLAGTGDPHTVLMTPAQHERMQEQMQDAAFGGIGIHVELDRTRHHRLTVVEPMEEGPAHRAGLRAGDEIVQVDHRPTNGMDLETATALIRGEPGTRVVLAVRRPGRAGPQEFTVTRARVDVANVTSRMLPGRVGLVRLRVFGQGSASDFSDHLVRLRTEGARGLIVDLRNNKGGYLLAALDICGHFVAPGSLVTVLADGDGARQEHFSSRSRARTSLPVALLVNEYTASASEIVAGCLKDRKTAILVGTRTFGKGSVQNLIPLLDGGALKTTVARFSTPTGRQIDRLGVEPDIPVPMEPIAAGGGPGDTQLRVALEHLRARTASPVSSRSTARFRRPRRT